MSVVGDLEEFETAVFDENLDLCRVCIDRVFDEFFQRVGGTLDNFTCSDFVNDLGIRKCMKGPDLFVETFDGFDDGVGVGMWTFLPSGGGGWVHGRARNRQEIDRHLVGIRNFRNSPA